MGRVVGKCSIFHTELLRRIMNDGNGNGERHDEEDDDEGEIEITFHPREEALKELGVDLEAFEAALLDALDAHEEMVSGGDPETAPSFENITLELAGKPVRLGDVADVEMTLGDLDDDDEEDDDDRESASGSK